VWEPVQVIALEQAFRTTSAKKANLWQIISSRVAGKTAEACKARWLQDHPAGTPSPDSHER
jgi:hypothetical protein